MKPSLVLSALTALSLFANAGEPKPLRAGIIGLDTSHVLAFSQSLTKGPKKPEDAEKLAGVKMVAAYPQGSKDIESSTKRVPEYTEKVKAMGVEIVDSIDELLKRVDVVFLESNDGRVHLEQLKPVLAAKKPVFIDKPIAGDLADTIRILDLIKQSGVPAFCSSSLRFSKATQEVRNGSVGKVKHAETFSPAHREATHSELYWYAVHGCEALFTVMGTGCESVSSILISDGKFEVTGKWSGGRTGVFMDDQHASKYGGKAVGEKGEAPIGAYDSYDVLLFEIVKMFRTGKVPVSTEETLELYAFMEAAAQSSKKGGAEVTLKEVIDKARAEIAAKP
jgi:predicted dehydrogenase